MPIDNRSDCVIIEWASHHITLHREQSGLGLRMERGKAPAAVTSHYISTDIRAGAATETEANGQAQTMKVKQRSETEDVFVWKDFCC